MSATGKKIKVKLCTLNSDLWLRQFPNETPIWGDCEFIFDHTARDYDWFVVYNDLPRADMDEVLACPQRQTLLITTEPSSIKSYGIDFTRQFGAVLTSQPEWALPHPDRIFSQPALHWFYGWGKETLRTYDQILALKPEKKKTIATVCSSKKQRHTLHNRRYKFTWEIRDRLPELDVFGHGVRAMDDKAESLDDYRYHIAIENYLGEHHWTEKLADPFLAQCLPFYFGCPNAADYFPEESFVQIDIFDTEESYAVIEKTIRDREYEKRYPYILEARRRVVDEYNLFAVLSREISSRQGSDNLSTNGSIIYARRLLRKKRPLVAVRDLVEKNRVRLISLLGK